jgi:uncharacterized protein
MPKAHSRSIRVIALVLLLSVVGPLLPADQTRPASVTTAAQQAFLLRLSAAAIERTHHQVRYDPSYVRIPYPGGDVPADTGVCTDEVIRSYRALGIDLQKEVHEDIVRDGAAYALHSKGQIVRPDTNIDHRRVPNLMSFFARNGERLPITWFDQDYSPGDIVAWDLGGGILHIGIVVDRKAPHSDRYMVVHNIGAGPQLEDVLFSWKIIGHYRYFGPTLGAPAKN